MYDKTWSERLEDLQNMKRNIDYGRGYDAGFKEGYAKALENIHKTILISTPQPIIVKLSDGECKRLIEDINYGKL